MRIIQVSRPILDGNHVRSVATKAFSPASLAAFHGPGTRVEPWVNATRIVHIQLDSAMVPGVLRSLMGISGPTISARVEQNMLENGSTAVGVVNTMHLDIPGQSLIKTEPSFRIHCENNQTVVTGRVTLVAHLPAPLHALAERFMASRAQHDVERYVDFVTAISTHGQ